MIITRKHLPRRTILRGLGAAVALPLLDGMVPAMTAIARTAAAPIRRLGFFYVPNGMAMKYWEPEVEGAAFDLPRTLEPLAAHRDKLNVLTGLAAMEAYPQPGEGGGDHARAAGTYLTGMHIKRTTAADVLSGVSADQIAGRALASETQFASLELALESVELLGACDGTYACAYTNTISWRTPTAPLPMENDPARCSSGCSARLPAPIRRRGWRASGATAAFWIRYPTRLPRCVCASRRATR